MLTTMSWAVTAWPPVGGLGGLGIVDDHFFSVNQDDQRQMIHTLLFSLQCSMWFEGFADPFIRDFGFTCHQVAVPHLLWQLPLLPLSVVFSFLYVHWGSYT